jgi:hypothetical protein
VPDQGAEEQVSPPAPVTEADALVVINGLVKGLKTTRGVAARLARAGIKGRVAATGDCPLQNYITSKLRELGYSGFRVLVGVGTFMITSMTASGLDLPLPELAEKFRYEFDGDMHTQLRY